MVVLLGGCAALHSPVDERPTIRDGLESTPQQDGAGETADDEGDGEAEGTRDAEAGDDRVQARARPVPVPVQREEPSQGADARDDDAETSSDDSPDFKVYRDDDRRKTCTELDREVAQLQGQSSAPMDNMPSAPGTGETEPSSTGILARLMDSSVVSGLRSTLTGEPSDDEKRETSIRQRIEWLREVKAEKGCYTTQPLF